MAVPEIDAGTAGDLAIAATGGKPVRSERERSSQPAFSPDDAPGARRFRLTSNGHRASDNNSGREARSALFESAGRCAGSWRRMRAFGAIARFSGPRPSFDDGRDLAGAEARVEFLGAPDNIWVHLGDLWANGVVGGLCVLCVFAVENARPSVPVVSRARARLGRPRGPGRGWRRWCRRCRGGCRAGVPRRSPMASRRGR